MVHFDTDANKVTVYNAGFSSIDSYIYLFCIPVLGRFNCKT